MCLLLISYNSHPNFKMIVAANRDEFYNRPASPAKFWDENPSMLAGKDLQAGGTWLGITKQGKFAAITNYRDMRHNKQNAPSRGELIYNFLSQKSSPLEFAEFLLNSAKNYNGYNLIFGDKEKLFYFSNQTENFINLQPGIYGLSNHLLDTPWPKVEKSKTSFKNILDQKNVSEEKLFEILSDKSLPADELLPDTGLSLLIERAVSPVFVDTPLYGTRSSTVILWDKDDNVLFNEKTLNTENKAWTKSEFKFKIEFD